MKDRMTGRKEQGSGWIEKLQPGRREKMEHTTEACFTNYSEADGHIGLSSHTAAAANHSTLFY